MARDPVCGMEVDEARASAKAEHKGKIYSFCAPICRERFLADPARYLAAPPHPPRPSFIPLKVTHNRVFSVRGKPPPPRTSPRRGGRGRGRERSNRPAPFRDVVRLLRRAD